MPTPVTCHPMLGSEQTRLGGEHTGVPQPCVESPRRQEMPRESGSLRAVLLKGGAVMLGSDCRKDVGPGEQRGRR